MIGIPGSGAFLLPYHPQVCCARPRPLRHWRSAPENGRGGGPPFPLLGLVSTPKLNFSVIVTPACAADTETEVLVACGAPEPGGGQVFLQILVVLGATNHTEVVAGGGWGTLSHALQTKEVGLQAGFIYEHVEGAKAVAGTGVGSVEIHDNVGVLRSPD